MRLWEQRILKPERSSSNAVLKGHVPVHGHITYRYSSYVCVSLLNTLSGGILTPFKLTRPKKVPPPPSNITYHDVKGQRDDMEKKRSLQGGGENVAAKAHSH